MDERSLQQHIVSSDEEQLRKLSSITTSNPSTTSESDGIFDSSSSEQGTESTTSEGDEEDGASSLDTSTEEDFESGSSYSDESISSRIAFLHEKQKLLKRVSDHFASEQAFNALNAERDLERYHSRNSAKQDSHGMSSTQ